MIQIDICNGHVDLTIVKAVNYLLMIKYFN